MKNLLLILILVVFGCSCSSTRTSSIHKSKIDSTHTKAVDSARVIKSSGSFESKKITRTQDTIRTKADSAKTNFAYNPEDTSYDDVFVTIESRGIRAETKFNKRTGQGWLNAYKLQEEIPVDKYQEETIKCSYDHSDSSGSSANETTALSKTEKHKETESSSNYTWLYLSIIFVLLLLLVAGYFWLRNQYVNPKR